MGKNNDFWVVGKSTNVVCEVLCWHKEVFCPSLLEQPIKFVCRPFETGQHCLPNTIFRLKSGVTFLSIANDSETNHSVSQAMLDSFAKAFKIMPLDQYESNFSLPLFSFNFGDSSIVEPLCVISLLTAFQKFSHKLKIACQNINL